MTHKNMKITYHDENTIAEVYKLNKLGHEFIEIIKRTGVSNPTDILKAIQFNLHKKTTNRNRFYKRAIKILKEEGYLKEKVTTKWVDTALFNEHQQASTETIKKQEDPFNALQTSFEQLQKSMEDFIEYQVAKKVADTKKELDVANGRIKHME